MVGAIAGPDSRHRDPGSAGVHRSTPATAHPAPTWGRSHHMVVTTSVPLRHNAGYAITLHVTSASIFDTGWETSFPAITVVQLLRSLASPPIGGQGALVYDLFIGHGPARSSEPEVGGPVNYPLKSGDHRRSNAAGRRHLRRTSTPQQLTPSRPARRTPALDHPDPDFPDPRYFLRQRTSPTPSTTACAISIRLPFPLSSTR